MKKNYTWHRLSIYFVFSKYYTNYHINFYLKKKLSKIRNTKIYSPDTNVFTKIRYGNCIARTKTEHLWSWWIIYKSSVVQISNFQIGRLLLISICNRKLVHLRNWQQMLPVPLYIGYLWVVTSCQQQPLSRVDTPMIK